MNKVALIFLFLFILKIHSEDYSPYEGLTKVVWTPGPSDIYLSDDSATSGKTGGISPFYNPEKKPSIEPLRAVGDIPARDLSRERLILSSSQGFAGVSKGKLYTYYDNKNQARTESIDPNPIQLGGYYLVLLYPFQKASSQKPYLSTSEGTGFYIKIDDDSVEMFKTAVKNKMQFSTAGYDYIPENMVRDSYAGLSSSDYLKTYSELLNKFNVRYESVLFVKDNLGKNTGITKTGECIPAILVSYGVKCFAYAMYGVWKDETKAKEFGFKKDQRVYFTEKTLLPDAETYASYPNVSILQLSPSMRYGKKVYSEEEILKNKKKYFPLLAWRSFKAWSEMGAKDGRQYDKDGNILKIAGQDEYPPNGPDNTDNTNGPGMTDCPDKDWYWDLFCQCVEGKLKEGSEETVDSKKYQDYKDYLGIRAMQQQYDPTVYGMDGSTSPQTIETENQPVDPSIYNKDCKLLNGKEVAIYDPFASDAKFSLTERYYDTDFLHQHVGYFRRGHDITDKFKNSLGELKNVYDYYVTNKGKETSWGYTKVGRNYTKKWSHGGDIEITIKPEFKDSAWYIADGIANYEAFENFQIFSIYDDNTVEGSGPYYIFDYPVTEREKDKKGKPEYQRYDMDSYAVMYEGTVQQGGPEVSKDWYIQWRYNLVYKDKWDRKISIGTLKFTSSLWKNESSTIMPDGFDFNGDKMNQKITIGGKSPFKDPARDYDKNSKDYRTDQTDPGDRSPDAEVSKGEAMWEIARKIAVGELFNLATKTVHYISQRNDEAGAAATVAYEASKRFENSVMIRKTCEMAKDMYKGYIFWRETMDIIKDCRDTYNSISAAWDGLRTSALGLYNYYKTIDFKKIRLTNVTRLLPDSYLYDVDMSLYCLQSSLVSFNKSVDALAFQSDRITRGNYGPFNPVILYATAELMQATSQSGEATSRFLENTTSALNQVTQGSSNSIANKAYLSNITKATYNAITNQRLMVMNERNRSAAVGLFILQQEANDWVTYNNHMRYAAGHTAEWTKQAAQNNFYPIIEGFQSPPGIFKDQGYWDALAKSEGKQQ